MLFTVNPNLQGKCISSNKFCVQHLPRTSEEFFDLFQTGLNPPDRVWREVGRETLNRWANAQLGHRSRIHYVMFTFLLERRSECWTKWSTSKSSSSIMKQPSFAPLHDCWNLQFLRGRPSHSLIWIVNHQRSFCVN